MKAKETLETALKHLTGDRAEQYGDMEQNHENIASLWSAYLEYEITPTDVAVLMALLKIARMKYGKNHPDNAIDGAAYLGIASELADKNKTPPSQETTVVATYFPTDHSSDWPNQQIDVARIYGTNGSNITTPTPWGHNK